MRRRRALRNALTDSGVSLERAKRYLADWEHEAAVRQLDTESGDFWREGRNWVEAQRSRR
jgi:hypothetical protein